MSEFVRRLAEQRQRSFVRAIAEKRAGTQAAPDAENGLLDNAVGFVKGAAVNTLVGLYDAGKRLLTPPENLRDRALAAVLGPAGPLVGDIVEGQIETGRKAMDARSTALQAGKLSDMAKANAYGVAALVPMLGPATAASVEKWADGKPGEALGEIAANFIPLKLPKNLPRRTLFTKTTNPARAAAVDYLKSKGVAPGLAAETGSYYASAGQRMADNTFFGHKVAARYEDANAAALRAEADRLANEAYPSPVTPHEVGQGVQTAIDAKLSGDEQALRAERRAIADTVHPRPVTPYQAGESAVKRIDRKGAKLAERADAAYGRAWEIASSPENVQRVLVGFERPTAELDGVARSLTNKGWDKLSLEDQRKVVAIAEETGLDVAPKPVYEQIATPVDMQAIQRAAEPLYRRMQTWMDPAKRNASEGFQALRSIVEGPKYRSAQDAEAGLSGLKSLAREAPKEWARDVSQGVAAGLVKQLQAAIDASVAAAPSGGGEALARLREGRRLTRAKYGVLEIAQKLREEPAQTFAQLTYARDAGVKFLRRIGKEDKAVLGEIGRAWLEDIDSRIALAGGVTDAIKHLWDNLGPQTRQLLYGDRAPLLDAYFQRGLALYHNPLRKQLSRPEASRIYDQIVSPHDASIGFQRDMAAVAPGEMGKAGRAWLDQVFARATGEGGFDLRRAAGMATEWENLGKETRQKLFPNPAHRADLQKFFTGIKAMGENPNPSGTELTRTVKGEAARWLTGASVAGGSLASGHPVGAVVAALGGPATTLLGGLISELMHSPKGVRLLTEGLKLPAASPRAAAIAAQLLRMAGEQAAKREEKREPAR